MKVLNKILIRKAKVSDLSELLHLNYSLNIYHQKLDPLFKPKRKIKTTCIKLLKNHIYSRNKLIIVAELDGKIVGFITSNILQAPYWIEEKLVGKISQAFINPKFRHLAIGKIMTNKIFDWFKQKKVYRAEVGFHVKNKIGKNAWHKYGFKDSIIIAIKRLK